MIGKYYNWAVTVFTLLCNFTIFISKESITDNDRDKRKVNTTGKQINDMAFNLRKYSLTEAVGVAVLLSRTGFSTKPTLLITVLRIELLNDTTSLHLLQQQQHCYYFNLINRSLPLNAAIRSAHRNS